jgi:hypothetical protein
MFSNFSQKTVLDLLDLLDDFCESAKNADFIAILGLFSSNVSAPKSAFLTEKRRFLKFGVWILN